MRHGSQPRVGSRFWLDWNGRPLVLYEGENIVGRNPRCSVWMDEPRVSGRHARIMVSADTATLEDLESLNHTFLRGAQITSVQELAKGDVIRFGVTDVTFRDSAVETERVGQPRRQVVSYRRNSLIDETVEPNRPPIPWAASSGPSCQLVEPGCNHENSKTRKRIHVTAVGVPFRKM